MKLFLIKSTKVKYKVAQRVLSFKKKTSLTVMNMHSNLLVVVCTDPSPLGKGGGEDEPQPNFQKGGKLDRTSIFRVDLLGKRG